MKKIDPVTIQRITKKVRSHFYYFEGNPYDQTQRIQFERLVDEKVLYYLQVGEEVLDAEIAETLKHQDDWHLRQTKEWRKSNCDRTCKHEYETK